MENASKALLMAGGVLIAILVLSLATRLFKSAYSVSKTYDDQMQATESRSFNAHFTKFYGAPKTDGTVQQQATIHDIITTVNFVKNYNNQMQENPLDTTDPVHVRIDLKGSQGSTNQIINLETYDNKLYTELIKKCYYKKADSPMINDNGVVHFEITINNQNNAGKINHVTFTADSPEINGYIKTNP